MEKIHQANSLRARLAKPSAPTLLGVQPEARKIRPSRFGRLHGQHPIIQGHPPVAFESGLECRFLDCVVVASSFESIRSQPVTIHYRVSGCSRPGRYTPDFQLKMSAPIAVCGVQLQRRCFVEVKPLSVALEQESQLRHKFSAVLLAMSVSVVLITDADLDMTGWRHG
jgi:hypothetical protein